MAVNIIYKYPVPSSPDTFAIELPHGARILSIQMQGGEPMMWVQQKLDEPFVTRKFQVVPTGYEFDFQGVYLGTFQAGPYVWHVFEDVGS